MANSFSNYVPFVCIGILFFSLISRRPFAGFLTIVILLLYEAIVTCKISSLFKITTLMTLSILIAATALSKKGKNTRAEFGKTFDSSDVCRELAKSFLVVFTQIFILLVVRLLLSLMQKCHLLPFPVQ